MALVEAKRVKVPQGKVELVCELVDDVLGLATAQVCRAGLQFEAQGGDALRADVGSCRAAGTAPAPRLRSARHRDGGRK